MFLVLLVTTFVVQNLGLHLHVGLSRRPAFALDAHKRDLRKYRKATKADDILRLTKTTHTPTSSPPKSAQSPISVENDDNANDNADTSNEFLTRR